MDKTKATLRVANNNSTINNISNKSFQPNNIPEILKSFNQWLLWKFNDNKKIPLNLNYYPTDPTKGFSFQSVFKAYDSSRCSGLGFITGNGVVAVDLDHCFINSKLNSLAETLVTELNTYTEISQSGTGLHLFFIDNNVPNFNRKNNQLEIYTFNHYIAMTGNRLSNSPTDLNTLNGKTKELLEKYFIQRIPIQQIQQSHNNTVNSIEILKEKFQHDKKFQQLFNGNIEGYNSQSEADAALLLKLALYTNCCKEKMRELFSQSVLGKRDKWIERIDYQEYQLNNVINYVNREVIMMGEYVKRKDMHPQRWKEWTNRYKRNSLWSTGFKNLDDVQILPPSLISLPAVYGMGKTTFAHQLGENIAAQGKPVLYMSFETDIETLHSKSILRRVKQINFNTSLTSQQIKEGEISPTVQQVLKWEEQNNDPFYYQYVPESIDIDNIIDFLKSWVKNHPEPFIIIDYLQYIQSKIGGTTKEKMDYIVRKLKAFIIETQTTILVLSSVNRANYYSDISGDSIKESGGIEYTADISWGLQLEVMEGKDSNNKCKYQEWLQAKSQNPRKMMIRCLKNRFGDSNYVVYFDYYADYDLFVERTPLEIDNNVDNSTYVDESLWRDDGCQ